MDPFLPDDRKVAAIRALLPATGAGIFLDTPAAGPLPAETATALREADDWELRVGRGGADHAADAALRREEAAGVLAAVLGVSPDAVVPVAGVRAATVALLTALPGAGPLHALEGLDPEVAAAARGVAAARGWSVVPDVARASVVVAPAIRATDGVPVDLSALRAGLGPTGLLVADLTLAAGSLAGSPLAAVDAAILATDRWLLGPDGTAAVVIRPGMEAVRELAGPLPRRAALGLGRSVGWLLMYVGLPWAVARTGEMAVRLHAALGAIPGVVVRGGPAAAGSPILAFTINGWTPDEAADELGRRVFAISGRTPDGAALRLGVGPWNTAEELDRFARAVAELAAHTPATLPRRPAIEVLGG